MAEVMFRGARLKLERAHTHIEDFNARASAFFQESACTITFKRDSKTGEEFVEIIAAQTIPDSFAPILGDALHNLRSALDHIWYELTAHDSLRREKVNFPIYPALQELEAYFKKGKDQPSIVALADIILNVIQPYKGGNGDILYCLHHLNIYDKHRLLIPQFQAMRISGLWVEDDKGTRFGIKTKLLTSGRPLILIHKGSCNLKLIDQGQCAATIVFGKGTVMSGHLVVPVLREFEVAINRLMEIFG